MKNSGEKWKTNISKWREIYKNKQGGGNQMKNDETLNNHPSTTLSVHFDVIDFLWGSFWEFAERNSSEEGRPHPTTWFLYACVTHSLSHLFNPNVRHRRKKRKKGREKSDWGHNNIPHPPNPTSSFFLIKIKQTNQCGTYKQGQGESLKKIPSLFEKKSLDDNNQTSIIF